MYSHLLEQVMGEVSELNGGPVVHHPWYESRFRAWKSPTTAAHARVVYGCSDAPQRTSRTPSGAVVITLGAVHEPPRYVTVSPAVSPAMQYDTLAQDREVTMCGGSKAVVPAV